MANHKCKELDRMLAAIIKFGFKVDKSDGVTVKIYPPDKSMPVYYGHMGERGLHPIRRYLKNKCKIVVCD